MKIYRYSPIPMRLISKRLGQVLVAVYAFWLIGLAYGVQSLAAGPPKQIKQVFPNFTVSMDAAIEVGGVFAVYTIVTNTASSADPLGTTKIVMQWPQAVTFKGQRVNRLDAGEAMEKAGGGDKLLLALGDRGSELKEPLSSRIAGDVLAAPILPILAPGLLVAGPAALIYSSTQGPAYQQRLKIDAKEFQLSPTRLAPFGSRLLTFAEPPIDGLLPQWSERGYIFFPLGDYTALEVRAQEFHNSDTQGGPIETVTYPWQ